MEDSQQSGNGPSDAQAVAAANALDNPSNPSTGDEPTPRPSETTLDGDDVPEKFRGKKVADVLKSYEELEKQHSDTSYRFPDEAINAVLAAEPSLSRREAAQKLQDEIRANLAAPESSKKDTQVPHSELPSDVKEAVLFARESRFKEEHPEALDALNVIREIRDKPEYKGLSDAEIYEHPKNTWMRDKFGKKEPADQLSTAGGVETRPLDITAENVREKAASMDVEELEKTISKLG